MAAIAASRPGGLPPIALAWAGVLAALAATVLGVLAPLAVYSTSLAAFGLPHVLSELRYVDRRFGRRLGAPSAIIMAALLASTVAARAGVVAHLLAPSLETPVELGLVAALALTAARGDAVTRAAAVGLALVIGALAIADPFETMVGFSVLHNLTPLGFLWQLAPRSRRPAVVAWAGAAFLGLPLLVASGAPRVILAALVPGGPGLDPMGAGPLARDLPVYVPGSLIHSVHAADLFTASTVAQLAHYGAVIVVLPWLLSRWAPGSTGLVRWPRGLIFYGLISGLAGLALGGFIADFAGARAIYSLLAAFHAWVEIPMLVIALTARQPSSSPMANEAPLAASESGSA